MESKSFVTDSDITRLDIINGEEILNTGNTDAFNYDEKVTITKEIMKVTSYTSIAKKIKPPCEDNSEIFDRSLKSKAEE